VKQKAIARGLKKKKLLEDVSGDVEEEGERGSP
jgi:hypothetical protein